MEEDCRNASTIFKFHFQISLFGVLFLPRLKPNHAKKRTTWWESLLSMRVARDSHRKSERERERENERERNRVKQRDQASERERESERERKKESARTRAKGNGKLTTACKRTIPQTRWMVACVGPSRCRPYAADRDWRAAPDADRD